MISVRSLLLCQIAEDADKLNDDVRLQLSIVLKEQHKLRELIAQRDVIEKAHEILYKQRLL